MRIIYITLFAVSITVVLLTTVLSVKSDKAIAKNLHLLLNMTFFAGLGNLVVLVSQNRIICMLGYSVFFAGIDWIAYYLLRFTIEYTGFTGNFPKVQKAVKYVLLLDTVSMFLNLFLEHAFSCYPVVKDGEIYYRIHSYLCYDIHLVISYITISASLGLLVLKICKSSSLYRGKYICILAVLVALVAVDAVYVFMGGLVDMTVIGFVVGGLVIYYLTVIYVPHGALDRMLSMVIQDIGDSILLFDTVGNCLHVNRNAEQWANENADEVTKGVFEEWYTNTGQYYEMNVTRDVTATAKGGNRYLKVSRKPLYDGHNIFIGSFFHVRDITDEVEKIQRERYLATHDRLTGLYNKEMFYEKTEEYLVSNPDTEYLMVCSDIYNFKLVNDIFGTDCGDAILCRIADGLRRCCNRDDVYARIGNDRFGLLMPKKNFNRDFFMTEPGKAVYVDNDIHYPVKIYIGVYEIIKRDIPVSVMFDRALMALMNIKGNYRKLIAFYDDKLRNTFLQEQEIMGQFDDALASGQFQIYLQPQVTAANEVQGAEALVRWLHPQKGLIPPDVFISTFEKNDTIVKLDKYVWELACVKLQKWQEQGRDDIYLSVNISPRDFYYIDIYQTFVELVEKYQIKAQNLHLEITETTVMNDVTQRIELIGKLQKAGFLVEMDDFGSGYSSLNTLKDIHIDVMKVDMVFLQKTADVQRGRKILTSIIKLAQDLEISSIVEGVETAEQVEFLKQIKCDVYQGYYFAKPMPVAQFEERYM